MFREGVATSFVWQSSRNGNKFLATHLPKVKNWRKFILSRLADRIQYHRRKMSLFLTGRVVFILLFQLFAFFFVLFSTFTHFPIVFHNCFYFLIFNILSQSIGHFLFFLLPLSWNRFNTGSCSYFFNRKYVSERCYTGNRELFLTFWSWSIRGKRLQSEKAWPFRDNFIGMWSVVVVVVVVGMLCT
jgi:hypothetical protein